MTPRGPGTVVVQTPLRKLWVQVQRVATSLRQVRIPRSAIRELLSPLVVTLVPLYPPTLRPQLTTHRRPLAGTLRPGGGAGAGTLQDGEVQEPSRSPPGRGCSGTPWKGVRDPPKKGGCRDTKQCKFWRVSSVLIQGTFCFLGVRGGPEGGSGGGPENPGPGCHPRGSGWGLSAPGPRRPWGMSARTGV